MKNYSTSINKNANGFSLIELLVSLLIASIIFGGVIQVAMSGKRSSMDSEEVSFIQDNARFVIDQIKRDTRSAGFRGCAGANNTNIVNAVANDLDGFISISEGIQGFDGSVGDYPAQYLADVTANTDSFLVRFADTANELKVKSHNAGSAQFTLWTAQAIDPGTTFMVTDSSCRYSGVFQATGPGGNSNLLQHSASGGNCTSVLKTDDILHDCASCSGSSCASGAVVGLPYLNGATIMPFKSYAYYVGQSDILPNMPALKRRVLTSSGTAATTEVEELALGVEDLQITYGEDVDDDGVVNRFVDADEVTDWSAVTSLRMNIVFRSSMEVYPSDQNVSIQLDGNAYALSNDRFLRQVVSTTLRFRNI